MLGCPVAAGAIGPRSGPVELSGGEARGVHAHDDVVFRSVGVRHIGQGEAADTRLTVSHGDRSHARILSRTFVGMGWLWGSARDPLMAHVMPAPGRGGRGSPVAGALVSLRASGVNRGDHGQEQPGHGPPGDDAGDRGKEPRPGFPRCGRSSGANSTSPAASVHGEDHRQHRHREAPTLPVQRVDRGRRARGRHHQHVGADEQRRRRAARTKHDVRDDVRCRNDSHHSSHDLLRCPVSSARASRGRARPSSCV
jgi:hypothetical protein